MKKPINKFAVALWVIAAAFAVYNLWSLYTAVNMASALHTKFGDTIYLAGEGFTRVALSLILGCSQLVALGILIEMVDQIRWKLEQRQ